MPSAKVADGLDDVTAGLKRPSPDGGKEADNVAAFGRSNYSSLAFASRRRVGRRPGLARQPWAKARRWLKPLLISRVFRSVQMFALCFALFGGGIWTMADVPDDPGNVILDTIMVAVSLQFIIEMVVTSIVEHTVYPFSSFFWMDIIGTLSMAFEISFLLGNAGKLHDSDDGNVDGALLRAVRATKVAARAGRLTKVLKCLSMVGFHRKAKVRPIVEDIDADGERVHAKILSSRLVFTLSTKISLLTLTLVIVMPLFQIGQYPEEDLSMVAWVQQLEASYGVAYDALQRSPSSVSTDIFEGALASLREFYTGVNYQPVMVTGFPSSVTIDGRTVSIPGGETLLAEFPARATSLVRKSVSRCVVDRPECVAGRAQIYWDFTEAYQLAAALDAFLIVFIVGVMAAASANFNSTLDHLVVRPVEHVLGMLKVKATGVLKSLGSEDDDSDNEGEGVGRQSETELLQSIFAKLARLAALAQARNVASEAEIERLDAEGRGVVIDMMQVQVRSSGRHTTRDSTKMEISELDGSLASTTWEKELFESWRVDIFALSPERRKQLALYPFFGSQLALNTGRLWTNFDTFCRFQGVVQEGYRDTPYHNYMHACDTLHMTYRLLTSSGAVACFPEIDQHAVLVAALGHDLGHPGVTNAFLVETKHDLAIRWNDRSPLENMHCSRLLDICSDPLCDVFAKCDAAERKQARKVCISTILHTDLAQHVDMVRELQRLYELNTDLCESQATAGSELIQSYDDMVRKDVLLFLELFLHMADISNPLKPFDVCRAWSSRVMDEFFAQGDEEKRLGLPIGMLNDREKINKIGSQHGFITFLVSPLVLSAVQLFPPLFPLSTQMASNLVQFRRLWEEEQSPGIDDKRKRDADILKIQQTADLLQDRVFAT